MTKKPTNFVKHISIAFFRGTIDALTVVKGRKQEPELFMIVVGFAFVCMVFATLTFTAVTLAIFHSPFVKYLVYSLLGLCGVVVNAGLVFIAWAYWATRKDKKTGSGNKIEKQELLSENTSNPSLPENDTQKKKDSGSIDTSHRANLEKEDTVNKMSESLYEKIFVSARQVAIRYRFDKDTADDVAQDVALKLLEVFANKNSSLKTSNISAYIRGIMINRFADHYRSLKKRELEVEDIDWLTDTIDNSFYDTPDTGGKNIQTTIDDYINRHPNGFTAENRALWEIFKHQKYTVPEMMEKMGMVSHARFYTAKKRLVEKIIGIYEKIAPGGDCGLGA